MRGAATGFEAGPTDVVRRTAFLHERRPPSAGGAVVDPELVERWREEMLVGPELFATRVAGCGLTIEQFAELLAAPLPDVVNSEEFDRWLRSLTELCALFGTPRSLTKPRDLASASEVASLFWTFLQPFAELALKQLRGSCTALPAIGDEVLGHFLQSLLVRLAPRCLPTLVLELNIARLRGELSGQESAARFRHFIDDMLATRERWQAILEEYPLLYRMLVTAVDHWVEATATLLNRLSNDVTLLETTFGHSSGDFDRLVNVRTGLSDPHRRGQSVVHLVFASGVEVIYKPRNLGVDVRFREFLDAMHGLGLKERLATAQVIDRNDYGWVEVVKHLPCESPEDVALFYYRLGNLIALVHALGGVDFHLENIIASGSHPVLVDLEGLFHPRSIVIGADTGFVRAQQWLERSVLGTGLLPRATAVVQQRLDLSGVGGKPGQLWPRLVPVVVGSGTDEMRITLGEVAIKASMNRPWLRGGEVDAIEYVDTIVEGFWEASTLIERHRPSIERMLESFADVEVRHIPRPTVRYGMFLRESWHPDYLRDALARDRLLDKLWAEAEVRPELVPLVPSEQSDLRIGDIPYFTTRPGSRSIWNSRGEVVEDYFSESALDIARSRIRSTEQRDREQQASLIKQAVLFLDTEWTPSFGDAEIVDDEATSLPQEGIAATTIGQYLKERVIEGADDACWIGPVLQRNQHWEWHLAPTGTNLYEGLGGIALFLAALAEATERADFHDLATRALWPIRRQLQADHPVGTISVGAFSGSASLAYTLSAVSAIRRDPELMEEAIGGMLRLVPHIACDDQFDIVGGAAGCALVAVMLYRRTGDPRLLNIAANCGRRLLQTALRQDRGVGWIGLIADRPVAGFAHGAAGIAWALFELERALGERCFGSLAEDAIGYERSLYVAETQTWVDNRPGRLPNGFSTAAWCHGAAGIALGRLLCGRHRDDPTMRGEVEIALQETVRHGCGGSHCLCHGGLGNAEILWLASDVTGESAWRTKALDVVRSIAKTVLAKNWKCGLPGRVESPGFMTGVSGIGYSLLRFASPRRIPAPLWIELP